MSDTVIRTHADLIWRVADKLRGVYKQSEYGRVILPLPVLRRLDCVLEPTKAAVLAHAGRRALAQLTFLCSPGTCLFETTGAQPPG